jgi:hypothetical protein
VTSEPRISQFSKIQPKNSDLWNDTSLNLQFSKVQSRKEFLIKSTLSNLQFDRFTRSKIALEILSSKIISLEKVRFRISNPLSF